MLDVRLREGTSALTNVCQKRKFALKAVRDQNRTHYEIRLLLPGGLSGAGYNSRQNIGFGLPLSTNPVSLGFGEIVGVVSGATFEIREHL